MRPAVSVVVPVHNGASTLGDCLRSLCAQNLPRDAYEIIVVDDGSTDGSVALAQAGGARVLRQSNSGAAAARNAGLAAASADWVAFTDADCVASRGWLTALLRTAAAGGGDLICVAGKTLGLASATPAARFVDLAGGLDAARHLGHPRYPFAPSGNVLYRRSALDEVGGYDVRYRSYEACDLHARLAVRGGRCVFEPAALVFHRHRASWRGYWRQQRSYGEGLGQFVRARYRDIGWTPMHEVRAWSALIRDAVGAVVPSGTNADAALVRRGNVVKALAQRVGFANTYWGFARLAGWRSALRCPVIVARAVRTPGDVMLLARIGAFIVRVPDLVRRSSVDELLRRLENERRPAASTTEAACERVARLRDAFLALPRLRRRGTCYIRALTLYRFVDPGAHRMRMHFGVEQRSGTANRLHSHAWISIDGQPVEAPPALLERRIREVRLPHVR